MNTFTKFLFTAGVAALGGHAASAQVLYDNFEDTRLVTYAYTDGTLDPIATPGGGTVNTSATSGKYDRNTVQYAVIVINPTNAHMADVSAYSAGTKQLTLKFRSPGPGTAVQLVLQNKAKAAISYPNGNYGGTFNATSTAAADTWETLTFTYMAGTAPAGSDAGSFDPTVMATEVDQMVMLVAPGSTTATTYYLDDIMGPELVAGPLTPVVTPPVVTPPVTSAPVLLDDFESTRLLKYVSAQGTVDEAAANPGANSVDGSTTCASFARDGGQQYATIVLQPKAGKFGDVSGYASGAQKITMKLYSPEPNTKVQIVLQNAAKATAYPNGNYGGTFDAVTSATPNAWQTLTFTYTAAGNFDATVLPTDVDQIALLIAPGTAVATPPVNVTYYFDDLTGPAIASTVTATRATSTAALASVYPNPATGSAHLPYTLQKASVVSLAVYDMLGRRAAAVLDNQAQPAGEQRADFSTAGLAPGLYTCRLVVDGAVLTRQLSVQ